MERRLLKPGEDWDRLDETFRWSVPEYFNIAEACCDSWARSDPDRVAIIDADEGGPDWTYGALKDASDRLAAVWAGEGLGKGDRVAILLPQSPMVMIAHFAAYKLGAIVVPLFSLFSGDALAYRLSDSGTSVVVTDAAGAEKLAPLVPDLPNLHAIFTTDSTGRDAWAAIRAAAPLANLEKTRADDPAILIYTSGTTGPPKGALHAHRYLLGHLPSIELHHRWFPQPGDTGWTPADWAWIGGLMDLAMPCLYFGVPLVSRRFAKFDAAKAWNLIARYNIRTLFVPPTALRLMRQAPVPRGVAIRSISSGGEALGQGLQDWARDTLGVEVSEIYGQTECNIVISSVPGFMDTRDGAMGRPVPGVKMSIRDPEGRALPDGEMGEICIKRGTPVMFLEYWNKPDKTHDKFHGDWLRTGDLGRRDADGLYTFVSRDDDVITSSGYRIGPTEIETCLTSHPAVVMCAVVGAPDEMRTESVVAHIVLAEGTNWTDDLQAELVDLVRTRVSPHVAPRQIKVHKTLPTTATGKIIRRALREG